MVICHQTLKGVLCCFYKLLTSKIYGMKFMGNLWFKITLRLNLCQYLRQKKLFRESYVVSTNFSYYQDILNENHGRLIRLDYTSSEFVSTVEANKLFREFMLSLQIFLTTKIYGMKLIGT